MSEDKTIEKIVIIISAEKLPDGSVSKTINVTGYGFYYYEIIGILTSASYEFILRDMKERRNEKWEEFKADKK